MRTKALLTTGLMLFAAPARADAEAFEGGSDAVQDTVALLAPRDEESRDHVRLGLGFGSRPDYVGSATDRLAVMPIVDIRFGHWRLTHNRLSFSAYDAGGWEAGPLLKYKSGRSESRSPVLAGLGDISPTAQAGLFVKYRTDRMLFRLEALQALGQGQGLVVNASFGHALYRHGNFALGAAVRAKWLNGTAMQTNFGLSTDQALASGAGLAPFAPGAGFSEVSLNVLARQTLGPHVRLLGLASIARLTGNAANSPLVAEAGERNQLSAGVGFMYEF